MNGGSRSTRRRLRSGAPLAVLAIALATMTILSPGRATAEQDGSGPPFPAGSIGVVGCSNTAEHIDGYVAASDLDQMYPTRLGGLSFDMWGTPSSRDFDSAWRKYESARPADGYRAAWVQMCITEGTPDPNGILAVVVDEIHSRDPGIPIYVSPLNRYVEGHVCGRVGPQGFEVGQAVVDWGVENLPVQRGPITGPLGPDEISSGDNCHLSPAGIVMVGDQLVSWFDLGGWQGEAGPPPAGPVTGTPIPALQPLCSLMAPLGAVGVLPDLAVCAAS